MMKHILVTGATGNLGKAVTIRFLEEGHRVTALISHRHDPGFMKHDRLRVLQADLEKEKEAEQAISQAVDGKMALDMGVLTVGGFAMGRLPDTTDKELEKMYRLNFLTAYHTARPLFGHMTAKGNGGQIVFIGARPGNTPGAASGMVAYSLSKSLIFKLAEIINVEGKEKKITASVIVPSIIDTPQNREALPDANFSDWVTPEEIAANMVHLITPAGRQLRKVVLNIYGNS
jgi:NAD(P)-dependent dehydrogenase (short-subunit alcohol dehydrogenase family)